MKAASLRSGNIRSGVMSSRDLAFVLIVLIGAFLFGFLSWLTSTSGGPSDDDRRGLWTYIYRGKDKGDE